MDEISPPESGRAAQGDTSIARVLGILDLFTPDAPVWTVDMLVDRLLVGRATIYRYIRALCDAGFLVAVSRAGYVLGPRFIEFDRSIRMADPLLQIVPLVSAKRPDGKRGKTPGTQVQQSRMPHDQMAVFRHRCHGESRIDPGAVRDCPGFCPSYA